jgi:hypothetical protein
LQPHYFFSDLVDELPESEPARSVHREQLFGEPVEVAGSEGGGRALELMGNYTGSLYVS